MEDQCIFLSSCAYSKAELREIPEKIDNLVEENGYAESFDIFPANFTDSDIEQVLFKDLDLPAIIYENS